MAHAVSNVIVDYAYWVFLAMLVLNLIQRRHRGEAQRKRFAVLYLAIMVFVLYIFSYGLIRLNISDWFLLVYAGVVAVLLAVFRETFLPFTLRCRGCGAILTFDRILFSDSNLCVECAASNRGENHSR